MIGQIPYKVNRSQSNIGGQRLHKFNASRKIKIIKTLKSIAKCFIYRRVWIQKIMSVDLSCRSLNNFEIL